MYQKIQKNQCWRLWTAFVDVLLLSRFLLNFYWIFLPKIKLFSYHCVCGLSRETPGVNSIFIIRQINPIIIVISQLVDWILAAYVLSLFWRWWFPAWPSGTFNFSHLFNMSFHVRHVTSLIFLSLIEVRISNASMTFINLSVWSTCKDLPDIAFNDK